MDHQEEQEDLDLKVKRKLTESQEYKRIRENKVLPVPQDPLKEEASEAIRVGQASLG